jgi:hypothetical protein
MAPAVAERRYPIPDADRMKIPIERFSSLPQRRRLRLIEW